MVMTAAATALGSIKAAYDLAKGAHSLQVSTEVRLAITDMLDKLVDAKRDAHEALEREESLLQRVRELETEIGRLKEQTADLENYEPKSFYPGVTAYVLKASLTAGRHPHKLCSNCYANGLKSELNPTTKIERRYRQHICASCKTQYYLGDEIPVSMDGSVAPEPEPARHAAISDRNLGPNGWMKG